MQYIGKEKQDNLSVYHYKVGVNKTNLEAYNKNLCENLAKTKLFKLFSSDSSGGDTDLIKSAKTPQAYLESIRPAQPTLG